MNVKKIAVELSEAWNVDVGDHAINAERREVGEAIIRDALLEERGRCKGHILTVRGTLMRGPGRVFLEKLDGAIDKIDSGANP